jgi:hypothetical protein
VRKEDRKERQERVNRESKRKNEAVNKSDAHQVLNIFFVFAASQTKNQRGAVTCRPIWPSKQRFEIQTRTFGPVRGSNRLNKHAQRI